MSNDSCTLIIPGLYILGKSKRLHLAKNLLSSCLVDCNLIHITDVLDDPLVNLIQFSLKQIDKLHPLKLNRRHRCWTNGIDFTVDLLFETFHV